MHTWCYWGSRDSSALNVTCPWLVHFFPFPVHCAWANRIVCGWILLGPQRGHPRGALHLLLIRGAAPQPRLSNLAACLKYNYVWLGVERRTGVWGCHRVCAEWGLGVLLSVFPYCELMQGCGEGAGRQGAGEAATYQTPRHQVLGLNHNTANYLLLTRKNEHGLHMKKIGLSGKRWHIDCLVCASRRLGFRVLPIYM